MIKSYRFPIILAIAVAMVLVIGTYGLTQAADKKDLPIENSRNFVDIIEKIHDYYVYDTTDDDLFENAIRGMLTGLDPHSAYLSQNENEELNIRTKGEFGGLGIQISMSDEGYVRVISPIDGTPAKEAGLIAQDLIVGLDGKPVKGLNLEQVLDIMRGKPGTKITLTIVRENTQTFDVSIVRDIIKLPSVRAEQISDGYGYIRLSVFQGATGQDMVNAISELQAKNKLKGLILDLRNNPGGLLNSAINVSDVFLPKDVLVVYTEGRVSNSNQKFFSKNNDLTNGVPIVVLINGGSASASEIVSGALQDHKRAVIMGTPSFGKGSVQTVIQLRNGDAIKLTTALYFTPSGNSIQAEGIQPDILVEQATVNTKESGNRIKEADLRDHLANADSTEETTEQEDKPEISSELLSDFQIKEAFNLLKGLNIYSSANQ